MEENKPKPPAPVKENKLAIQVTPEDVRKVVGKTLQITSDPEYVFKEVADQMNKALKSGKNTDKALEEVQVKINSYSEQALMTLGLDNHYVLADSVSEHLRGLAIETARQIEKEYDCKTPSEKILAEMVSSAYVRTLQYTKQFNISTREEFVSKEKNGHYALYSKEVDRAQRHLMAAIATLKQIKSPNVEMNIRTKNAFIAQNQQFNANTPPNPKENENNESK
jgi:hypothetical protein